MHRSHPADDKCQIARRALQLQTVAEGIETQEQWSTLQGLGCEFGQGYLFALPGAADAISHDPRRRPIRVTSA